MSEWISVEDRLPEEEGEYFIWPPGKYAGKVVYFNKYVDDNDHEKNTFETVSRFDEVFQIHVTHWQHLPEPPKKGNV